MCDCGGSVSGSVSMGFSNQRKATTRFTKNKPAVEPTPAVKNVRQENDVYAQVLFNDGRPRVASGRDYGLMIRGKSYFVDPIDVAKHPYLFKELPKEKWPNEPIGDSVLVSADVASVESIGVGEGTVQADGEAESALRDRRTRRFTGKVD